MGILECVPEGYILRDVQRKVLLEIEEHWQEYDAFVIDAPVAAGKSLISITLANWRNASDESVAILTPKAMLQDQYNRDFPQIPSLKGKGRYPCKQKDFKSCGEFHEVAGFYCSGGCSYKDSLSEAQEATQAVFNFHSHLFNGMVHNMYKDTLVIDEAHNLVPMLSDIYTLKIWKHKERWDRPTNTKDDIVEWLAGEIARLDSDVRRMRAIYGKRDRMSKTARKELLNNTRKLAKYKMIKDGLTVPQELFNIALTNQRYGRSRKEEECIEVKPISLKTVPHQMWPDGTVKKLVMMSATVYEKDIERLGLKRKRVRYVSCSSPIPKENRPVVIRPVAPMSFKNIKESTRALSQEIKKLGDQHEGKGIIHITYGLVREFKKYLKGDRYIWHTDLNREEKYEEFLEAEGGKILMACGMGEGIDLVGPEFEWQVIAKVAFPSLKDPLQQHFIQRDPIVYAMETARTIVQQTGRICRTPSDYGITYILDQSFASFYRRATDRKPHYELFPDYFIDAMIWGNK